MFNPAQGCNRRIRADTGREKESCCCLTACICSQTPGWALLTNRLVSPSLRHVTKRSRTYTYWQSRRRHFNITARIEKFASSSLRRRGYLGRPCLATVSGITGT